MKHHAVLTNLDAIIFDMDGTLWDALASYAHIWNVCMAEFSISGHVEAPDLLRYMGYSIDEIFAQGIISTPEGLDRNAFLKRLEEIEDELMPTLGGALFPGVYDGLQALSKHFTLMLQSNCSGKGLVNFQRFTATEEFFADYLSWGMNPVPKSENIKLLMERNGIKRAVYVGDTQADCNQAHAAGVPFVHMTYGFGTCTDADVQCASFTEFVNQVISSNHEQ
ncbi:MAG: HAD family hydrolase [Bacteroidales bacterium]|nr:HAD family hydrolase [Bacteroidales bacterium]